MKKNIKVLMASLAAGPSVSPTTEATANVASTANTAFAPVAKVLMHH